MLDNNLSVTNNQGDVECTIHTVDEGEIIKVWRYWLEGVLQFSLSILGLLTNSLSIFVLTRKSLAYKTFNQLLTSLAIFDSIFLIIMFFESLGSSFEMRTRDWYYIKALLTPYFLYPFKAISMTGSVYMMVAVAVERHIAVCMPFSRIPETARHGSSIHSKKKLKYQFLVYLLLVIFFSIALNITKFLESSFIPEPPFLQISPLRFNSTYLFVFACIRLLFLGIVPLFVVSILNYRIYKTVHKSSRSGNKDDTLSVVLTFIVVIFILCSLPRLIILMYEVSMLSTMKQCSHERRLFPMWNHILGLVSHNLLVLNPFLNFIVYCVVGRTFRRVASSYLRKLVCCNSVQLSPDQGTYLRRESRLTWSFLGPQAGSRRQSLFKSINVPHIVGGNMVEIKMVNQVGDNLENQIEGNLRNKRNIGDRNVLEDVKEDCEELQQNWL